MRTIKTIFATTVVFLCCSFAVWGQSLKVNGGGLTNFGNAITIYPKVPEITSSQGLRAAIDINLINAHGLPPIYGLHSVISQGSNAPNGDCVGIYGYANNQTTHGFPARYIGVHGGAYGNSAGNRATLGVAGIAGLCNNSVGIYGGISSLPTSLSFSNPYAGYFQGSVKIVGTLNATTVTTSSDERLKRNIEAIDKNNAIEKLYSLRPIKYNLKQIEREDDSINDQGEKVVFKVKRYDEEDQYFKKLHYGLVAQELQKVYPELVYDGGDGYLEIDYIGLVPLLLQAIQQQQKQIEELQIKNPDYFTEENPTQPNKSPQQQTNGADNALYQNSPNPFNISTTIKYQLSNNATNAKICIYNLTGKQLQCYNLPTTKGENLIEVRASSLQAGMYLYSLIVDDKLIATKRMVLTE